MLAAVLPHPILSATVALVWILLVNEVSAGQALLAVAIGLAVPKFAAAYWPDRPRIRRPLLIVEYVGIVLYDIVRSNIQVARLVLFHRGEALRSRMVVVPLTLRSPEAIAVLAGTITMTPGTVTADVTDDRRALLVHCLDVQSEQAAVDEIKRRYEARLLRILP